MRGTESRPLRQLYKSFKIKHLHDPGSRVLSACCLTKHPTFVIILVNYLVVPHRLIKPDALLSESLGLNP
jgi:hypothetical protein